MVEVGAAFAGPANALPIEATIGLPDASKVLLEEAIGDGVSADTASWIAEWCVGFDFDLRASHAVVDRRSSNGGKHPKNGHSYDAVWQAQFIRSAELHEQLGTKNPNSRALREVDGIFSHRRHNGKLTHNLVYSNMHNCLGRWRTEPLRSHILAKAAMTRSEKRALSAIKRKGHGNSCLHYPDMEKALKAEVRASRALKRPVTTKWLCVRARQLVKAHPEWQKEGHSEFKATTRWRIGFMRREHLSIRKKTNSKQKSVLERRDLLLGWHRRFRLHMQRGVQQCSVYGRYDREHRWNVDQVPLPFVIEQGVTVDETGAQFVQIVGPGESYEKRQCTLQVCFRGIGEQPRLAIIFNGTPKHRESPGNIDEDEMLELNQTGIDWYFQKKVHV